MRQVTSLLQGLVDRIGAKRPREHKKYERQGCGKYVVSLLLRSHRWAGETAPTTAIVPYARQCVSDSLSDERAPSL